MGLLDKIESVLPGHDKTKDHTTHTETTRTDSATGEHGTSQHHHFGHSLHGLTGSHASEHSTPATTTTVHKEEHTGVPATTTTGTAAAHDSKTVAPVSSEHTTTTAIPATTSTTAPATTTTAAPAAAGTTSSSQTVSGSSASHTAGTKVDGPADTHHTSETLPPLAGSVFTGHPARYHDVHDSTISPGTTDHSLGKHEHNPAALGHSHQHNAAAPGHDAHKTEHGVTGLIHNLTGHGSDHKSETNTGEHATGPHIAEHATSTTGPVTTAAQALTSDVKKHDQAHEAVNFVPNAENPSAIPTAGGGVIGAGQVDHNATGTIGKEYPGDKPSSTGLVTSDHSTPATKDSALPDRTSANTAGTAPAPATHTA